MNGSEQIKHYQRLDLIKYTHPGTFLVADAINMIGAAPIPNLYLLDPPYDDIALIRLALVAAQAGRRRANFGTAIVCFMHLSDVPAVFDNDTQDEPTPIYPDTIAVWEKPISTKNTARNYSRFLEAICVWHGENFNSDLHWANRTGIFTDRFIEKPSFEHKKPDTLIERLVKLHAPYVGTVLDPFAGAHTTETVCDRIGYYSLSSDIVERPAE